MAMFMTDLRTLAVGTFNYFRIRFICLRNAYGVFCPSNACSVQQLQVQVLKSLNGGLNPVYMFWEIRLDDFRIHGKNIESSHGLGHHVIESGKQDERGHSFWKFVI